MKTTIIQIFLILLGTAYLIVGEHALSAIYIACSLVVAALS